MSWLVGLVLVFGVAAVGLPFFFGAGDRWEYKIVAPSDYGLTDDLNDLGRTGWEVVSARRAVGAGIASYEFILKRRISALAIFSPHSTALPSQAVSASATPESHASEPSLPEPNQTVPDYQVLDHQGANIFALLASRFARDTARIHQFGSNLCESRRPCIVRFWTERPSDAFRLPLSPGQRSSEVAEFARGSAPDPGTVSLLK